MFYLFFKAFELFLLLKVGDPLIKVDHTFFTRSKKSSWRSHLASNLNWLYLLSETSCGKFRIIGAWPDPIIGWLLNVTKGYKFI